MQKFRLSSGLIVLILILFLIPFKSFAAIPATTPDPFFSEKTIEKPVFIPVIVWIAAGITGLTLTDGTIIVVGGITLFVVAKNLPAAPIQTTPRIAAPNNPRIPSGKPDSGDELYRIVVFLETAISIQQQLENAYENNPRFRATMDSLDRLYQSGEKLKVPYYVPGTKSTYYLGDYQPPMQKVGKELNSGQVKEIQDFLISPEVWLEYVSGFQPGGLTKLDLQMTSEEMQNILDSLELSQKALRLLQRHEDDLSLLNSIPADLGFDSHKMLKLRRLCEQGFQKACIIVNAYDELRKQEERDKNSRKGAITSNTVSFRLFELCRNAKVETAAQLYALGRRALSSRAISEATRKEIKSFLKENGFEDFQGWMSR